MFNPSRLTLARKRRGLTKTKLASEVDVTVRSITAYEAGATVPNEETTQRLSLALGFPAAFFFASDIEAPSLQGVSFRSLKSMTAGQRDAALGASALAIELATWIEDRFTLPSPDLPDLSDEQPEAAAESLRAAWGLGERPVRNVIHLLESRGVRVFSLAEECLQVDAFSFWRNGIPYVFLNTQKSGERSRLDAAHELGHLVLHKNDLPRSRDVEREAQKFGGALLMPRSSVLASVSGLITLPQLVRLKHVWGVAVSALTYRLHELGILSDWQYRSLFKELSAHGYRKTEPEPMSREASQILAKVFESLRSEGTGKRTIARDLKVKPEELNNLVFGLALLSVEGGAPKGGPPPAARQHTFRVVRPKRGGS